MSRAPKRADSTTSAARPARLGPRVQVRIAWRGGNGHHADMADWRKDKLPEIARELASRPGHEKVRALLHGVLTDGLRISSAEIEFEQYLKGIKGRADALFGSVVFEVKRDLRQEQDDVLRRLPDYLAEKERETGRRYLGIATDGAVFHAYELRDGAMVELNKFALDPAEPGALLAWLEPAVSSRDDLLADPLTFTRELGRQSLTYARALGALEAMWRAVSANVEVTLKRKLWDQHLSHVYGSAVGDDRLFLQHTYLTVVAKTVAARVLDAESDDAADILSGKLLADMGIAGAVESDFFDWVLKAPEGGDLVKRIARQVARFRLHKIEHDVLKGLYESLIDPAQRHDLGEYYTPDWLALRVVEAAVTEPLAMRVLDPACGSGTFLFHAVRRHLAVAEKARRKPAEAIADCVEKVRGIDVHPVAAIVARVTYLLAIGEARLKNRPRPLSVPVFLGDALQWSAPDMFARDDLRLRVPGEQRELVFPVGLAEDQAPFDQAVGTMVRMVEDKNEARDYAAWLKRELKVTDGEARVMESTYGQLRALYDSGRNHIWGFVARNLARPLWLARDDQKADAVVGNPPWLAYRFMSPDLQKTFRDRCRDRNLWAGGKLATQQDLSAYFFARALERYVKPGGLIAFVMPYAALNRPAFAGLRRGGYRWAQARFVAAWALDEHVQPLFPVPAAVLFARRADAGPLPKTVTAFKGDLPRRDATMAEAAKALTERDIPWPEGPTLAGASPYREEFRQGATIVPRRFAVVERVAAGRLGGNPAAPRVRGRVSSLDKKPWNTVEPLEGPVEREFLRPLYLGESILPYRPLPAPDAVIPWDEAGKDMLTADLARRRGYIHLARWLGAAETAWNRLASKAPSGGARMTLSERLNFQHGIANQFPIASRRVVFAASGTLPCAAVLEDDRAIIEHAVYWASVATILEARYLVAILNSESARDRVSHMQARGQWGARHFDKLVFELPIPRFARGEALHRELAEAAAEAEKVAATVALPEGIHFTRARQRVRAALADAGISQRIDGLVARLLDKA